MAQAPMDNGDRAWENAEFPFMSAEDIFKDPSGAFYVSATAFPLDKMKYLHVF